jgi:hypothetical protein
MGWQEEHAQRVAGFPAEVQAAHARSSNHREEVIASTLCGCFYCCATFPATEIDVWIDEDRTALCPRCGIDSVLGDRSGFPIHAEFLATMKAHWFGTLRGIGTSSSAASRPARKPWWKLW